MSPPHWSDPLPVRSVNNGRKSTCVPLPNKADAKGRRYARETPPTPRVEIYGRPPYDGQAPIQPCVRVRGGPK